MLYDRIILALIDLKKSIKEIFGDDGQNKKGKRNFTSGLFGFDRIQYEISRISAAIRHTTVGGSGTTNYNALTNHPSINDVELIGDKSAANLGLVAKPEMDADIEAAIAQLFAAVEVLLSSKANIEDRLAVGISRGNNIQGMHIRPKGPFAYYDDWTLVSTDGSTIIRTNNNLVYNPVNADPIEIAINGEVLIPDYKIETEFVVDDITGVFTNMNLFYRVLDNSDIDQRIGLLFDLPDGLSKASVVAAIVSLKGYVDAFMQSSEVDGSPYASYAAFLEGAGATVQQSKYSYVTFVNNTHPSGGNWDKIQIGDTWRMDCSTTAWSPTSNMTNAMTANILDQAGTFSLKTVGSDTVSAWIQSLRNNIKMLVGKFDQNGLVPINAGGTGAQTAAEARANLGMGNVENTSDSQKPVSTAQEVAIGAKQDSITSVGSTNLLTAPAIAGGQPGKKAIADFIQAPNGQTANTQLLVAPVNKGDAPALKAINTLLSSPDAQTANTQLLCAPVTKGAAPSLLPITSVVQPGIIGTLSTPATTAAKLAVGQATVGAVYLGEVTGGIPQGGYVGIVEKVSADNLYYCLWSTDNISSRGPICGNISTTATSWLIGNRSGLVNMTQLYGHPTLAELEATLGSAVIAYINGSGKVGMFHAVRKSATDWYYSYHNDSTGLWESGDITT